MVGATGRGVARARLGRALGRLEGRRAGSVRLDDELRLVRDGDERTLIVMVRVDGLGELYAELSGRLGAPLAPPPTHITLYTRPGGESIGVHDESNLRSLTEPLRGREAAAVRGAIGFDALPRTRLSTATSKSSSTGPPCMSESNHAPHPPSSRT